ncbi:hypothetical protein D1007_61126 [Hordeum vulgare]|nr:hypothetical protein D1007_61126 [Hordeum vulgare]
MEMECRPMCQTVSDAVHMLDAIVGYDEHDTAATGAASKYIPHIRYVLFLKKDGLKGKKIGIPNGFFQGYGQAQLNVYKQHVATMRLVEWLKYFGQLDVIRRLKELNANGLEKLMKEWQLDAIVVPNSNISSLLAIGGHPGIIVPAGYKYDEKGFPSAYASAGCRGMS